jgi:hypothetical protein
MMSTAPADETPPIELGPEVRAVLRRTPVRAWSGLALLLLEDGRTSIMSRGDLASMLRNDDLGTLADDISRRAAPAGSLLVLSLRGEGPRVFTLFGDEHSKRKAARR